jgi:hypothetical protein
MSRIDPTTLLLAILAAFLTLVWCAAAFLRGENSHIVAGLSPLIGGAWAAFYRHITGPAMIVGESEHATVTTNKQAEPEAGA